MNSPLLNSVFPILPWVLVGALLIAVGILSWRLRQAPEMHRDLVNELQRANTSLARIGRAIESASDAIGIGDMDGNSVYHNRAHMALFGYTLAELNAVPDVGTLFADPALAAEIHASIRNGRSWSGETEIRSKTGQHIPVFARADLITDADGQAIGILGVFTDITERRRIASSLDAERQRLAVTLQSIGDGVITTNAVGDVDLINPAAAALTGWSQAEGQSQPLSRVLALLDENTRSEFNLATPSDFAAAREISGVVLSRHGQEHIVSANIAPLSGSLGRVIAFRDLSLERQRALERERSAKVESLGLLAGGIAHDFANLLTCIMAHLSLAQMASGLPEPASNSLKEATKASWRARDMVQQLLSFARGGSPVKQRVELAAIVREYVAHSLHSAPNVAVTYILPDDLLPVLADPGQIGQVVQNLAVNAIQAMKDHGTLVITARNVPATGENGSTMSGVPSIYLGVADDGPGISPENVKKIFDPFFSTKSSGNGLGLATVYSIVDKHGGRIRVESVVGRGTTFHIYLPAAAELSGVNALRVAQAPAA